jgi:hypothetical protein
MSDEAADEEVAITATGPESVPAVPETTELHSEEGDTRIRGLVAEVISDREVVLNRGSTHGVREGMYFAILNPDTQQVTDPETGESLGGIRAVNVTVVAVEVAPKLTLARTFRTKRVNVGGNGVNWGRLLRGDNEEPNYVEQIERLTLRPDSPRRIDPSQSVVQRGDPFESADQYEVSDVRSITMWAAEG